MDRLLQDTRYALRTLARSPGFTLVALLTLALGIGANTAIFSVVNGVLLRPLPYRDADRLVRVYDQNREERVDNGSFSPQDFDDLAADTRGVYAAIASYSFVDGLTGATLRQHGEPTQLPAASVSGDFFRVLGVPARLGRVFGAAENVPGRDRVAVLSHRLWRTRFGADPGVVGRRIDLDGKPFTIIGVMPEAFAFPSRAVAVWLPLSLVGDDAVPHRRGIRWLDVVGRLAPGVSAGRAAVATSQVLRRLEQSYPDSNKGWGSARIRSLHDALVGDVRPALLVLLGVVALVLLIACANLANLFLARSTGRARELALRAALGANRRRIARQLLTESLILSLVGGVLGTVLSLRGVPLLVALGGGSIPRPDAIRPDLGVLAFALGVSLLTGLLFGLAPALRAGRADAGAVLKEGGRSGTAARERQRARGGLVVAEMALAVVLLTGAGLMAKSFWRLSHVDPGFHAENVLRLHLSIPEDRVDPADPFGSIARYREGMLDRLAQLPGVTAVGASKTVPLKGGGEPYAFQLEGDGRAVKPKAGTYIVTPGYFRALGIPIVKGRDFTRRDDGDRPALIINQALARQLFPGGDAVGQRLVWGEDPVPIIGVVGDVRNEGLASEGAPTVYIPATLAPRGSVNVFLRTTGDPLRLVAAARAAVWEVDPNQPVSDLARMSDVVAETIRQPRFFTTLVALFGSLAVILAAIGIYGVVAYAVRQRTAEIGVRMALGARAADVLRMVLGRSMATAGIGIALGFLGALALTRLLSSQLYGVGTTDAATFAATAAVLALVALLASWLPARRATKVDPMVALRSE